MADKIIDLRQDKKTKRKWFDIKEAARFSIGEKRKNSKLIKLLNQTFVVIVVAAAIVFLLHFLLKKKPKTIVFYDFIPDDSVSFNLISRKIEGISQIIGGVLDGIDVFNADFEEIDLIIEKEAVKVAEEAKLNVENEIIPYLGENIGIIALQESDNSYSFIIFIELKGSLQDVSFTKSKIEKALQISYKLDYATYKGVSISSISALSAENNFDWLCGHYVFIDKYLVLSNKVDSIKEIIDKSF